jgi:hypothetical protein
MLSGLPVVDPGISPQKAQGESDNISGYVYESLDLTTTGAPEPHGFGRRHEWY